MSDFHGQRMLAAEQIGCLPLSDEIEHVVGTAATLLEKPTGKTTLVLVSDRGGWRARLGDQTADMPAVEYPAAPVSDGSGALYIGASGLLILPGPSKVTVKGYASNSVLTYYWI